MSQASKPFNRLRPGYVTGKKIVVGPLRINNVFSKTFSWRQRNAMAQNAIARNTSDD